MYLSIIIPTYNEEKRLPKTLQSVIDFVKNQSYECEIIVSDDGSIDKTIDIVREFSAKYPQIILLDNQTNHGKGYVIRQAMLRATGQRCLFMDADGSTTISEVTSMFPYFENGYDVVIGSRRVGGSKIVLDQPRLRIFLGWIFRNLVNWIFDLNIIDTQNGFKMFSGKAVKKIFTHQKINGWAFDVEVLYLAKQNGLKIAEVPISWTNDMETKVTFQSSIKMIVDLVKIKIS